MSEHSEFQTNPVVGSQRTEQVIRQDFQPKLAGFWIRFWAYFIDLIVLYAISGIFIKPVFRVFGVEVSNPPFLFFTPYKITILVILLLYFTLMTKYLGQTVGKMIMGIKVIPQKGEHLTWGTLIFREIIGRFISKLLVFPYLLVAFMPKKEALHDLFADTYVIHEHAYEKKAHIGYLNNPRSEQLQEGPVI